VPRGFRAAGDTGLYWQGAKNPWRGKDRASARESVRNPTMVRRVDCGVSCQWTLLSPLWVESGRRASGIWGPYASRELVPSRKRHLAGRRRGSHIGVFSHFESVLRTPPPSHAKRSHHALVLLTLRDHR
jgi:hypothetical protein